MVRFLHGNVPITMHQAKDQKNTGPTLLELGLCLHGDLRRTLEPLRFTPLQAGLLCYLHRHADAHLGAVAAALRVRPPLVEGSARPGA